MIAIGSYILIYFVGFFVVEAIAGFTSAGRYEQLFFLPLLGLSTATVTIVGQNFGAKQYQRVIETYKKGIKVGVVILSLLGLFIFLSAELAMNLFTDKYPPSTNTNKVIIIGISSKIGTNLVLRFR